MKTELIKKRFISNFILVGLWAVAIIYILALLKIILFKYGLGASDVDDLILNTFGGFLSSLIYFTCLKKIHNKEKMKIATLGFLVVFGICSLISLYIYHPSVLPAKVYLLIRKCCWHLI